MAAKMRVLLAALPLLARAEPLRAPEFTIDLDLPPSQRHREVAKHFKAEYPTFMGAWDGMLGHLSSAERDEWMVHSNVKPEFREEIRGFVEEINHPKVTIQQVLLFNLMYELNFPTFCSGVLAMDSAGHVMHGRNLDLVMNYKAGRTQRVINDMAVNLTYIRDGVPAYNAPSFAGYFGLHTVMKLSGHHLWTFQQNSHFDNNRAKNLQAQKDGAVPFGFFMRELVGQDIDFRTAVLDIQSTAFSAPSFFLMAGANLWEGAAIEIRRNVSDASSNLGHVQVLSPQVGRWFLVQTNDRVWDNPEDDRRPAAIEMLHRLGGPSEMDAENLLRMMRTTPLYNDRTALSMVMVPSGGYVFSVLRGEHAEDLHTIMPHRRFKFFLH